MAGDVSGVPRLSVCDVTGMLPLEGVDAIMMVGWLEVGTPEGGEGLDLMVEAVVAPTGED